MCVCACARSLELDYPTSLGMCVFVCVSNQFKACVCSVAVTVGTHCIALPCVPSICCYATLWVWAVHESAQSKQVCGAFTGWLLCNADWYTYRGMKYRFSPDAQPPHLKQWWRLPTPQQVCVLPKRAGVPHTRCHPLTEVITSWDSPGSEWSIPFSKQLSVGTLE